MNTPIIKNSFVFMLAGSWLILIFILLIINSKLEISKIGKLQSAFCKNVFQVNLLILYYQALWLVPTMETVNNDSPDLFFYRIEFKQNIIKLPCENFPSNIKLKIKYKTEFKTIFSQPFYYFELFEQEKYLRYLLLNLTIIHAI